MDQQLLFLINREWTNPVLDRVMALMSSFDAWAPLVILVGLVLAIRGDFRARAFVLTAGLIVAINDGVVSNSLKKAVDRPRPHQSVNDVRQIDLAKAKPRTLAAFKPLKEKLSRVNLKDVEGRSFPSSHTINTVSVALVTACFYRRRGWLAFVPAALVGYSRVYTGSHWPSDVVTSVFLGLGFTMLWLLLLEWAWRTRGAHLLPRLHAAHPSLLAT